MSSSRASQPGSERSPVGGGVRDKRSGDGTRRVRGRALVRFGVEKLDRTGFSKNLSQGGLFIGTNNVHPPGTVLQLSLQFPDATFSLWGRVAWAKKVPPQLAHLLECGMGIEIIQPPPEWVEFFSRLKKRFGG